MHVFALGVYEPVALSSASLFSTRASILERKRMKHFTTLLAALMCLLLGLTPASAQVQKEIPAPKFAHNGSVLSVAFSRDGSMLASGSKDKTVKLWTVHDGSLLRTLRGF